LMDGNCVGVLTRQDGYSTIGAAGNSPERAEATASASSCETDAPRQKVPKRGESVRRRFRNAGGVGDDFTSRILRRRKRIRGRSGHIAYAPRKSRCPMPRDCPRQAGFMAKVWRRADAA
jgi:hypothetical protein